LETVHGSGADHEEIKETWNHAVDFEDALTKITSLWQAHPLLTFGVISTSSIQQDILAKKAALA